jgi:Tol biopolymer transport system component
MNTQRLTILAATLAGAAAVLLPTPGAAQRGPSVVAVQIQPSELQVQVGQSTQAFVQAYDRAGNALISVTSFTWRSSKPNIATVDSNGTVTGHAPGVALITARYGSGRTAHTSDPATVEVLAAGVAPQPQAQAAPAQPAAPRAAGRSLGVGCAAMTRQPAGTGPADGLFVSPQRVRLIKGESAQLQYHTVRGLMGETAEPACVVFSVDAGRVAQVDSFGLVSSVGDTGRAVLTVNVPGARWAPKQITVEVSGDSVQFSRRAVSLAPGVVDTLDLVVTKDGRRLDPAHTSFQFVSSDETKVQVSPVAPIITGVAPGTATIKATSGFFPDIAATVAVHPPIARLIGTPPDTLVILAMQGTTSFGIRFLAADTTTIEGVPVRWTLPDTVVARLDTVTMQLRGIKMGDTRIRVAARASRADSIYRNWHVRVVAGGLQIATPRFALPVGEQMPLAVQLLDDRRRPLGPATSLTWRSSADSIVRMTDGRAVGVAMGHAQVQARTTWDSTVTADAYVVGDLLVPALRNGRWDLFLVQRGEPVKVRAITQDSALEAQVAWSPNWTQIAYVAAPGRSELFDLFVANVDGSDTRRLTHDSLSAHSPAFVGPAGDQIVFESGRSGKSQLFLINKDGTGRRQLTTGDSPSSQPDVSPDGKRVLFVSLRDRNYNVYQMNLDGTGVEQRLTTGRKEDSPTYAHDGRSFYYLRLEPGSAPSNRVYNQDLTTGVATPITPAGVFVQAYSLSTDGRTVAVMVAPPDPRGMPDVEMLDRVTGVRLGFTLPGVERVGAPAFRPAAPQAPAAPH